jgi:hypothetical protein
VEQRVTRTTTAAMSRPVVCGGTVAVAKARLSHSKESLVGVACLALSAMFRCLAKCCRKVGSLKISTSLSHPR